MGNPHEGHRERVRKRFFEEGLEHFAPHEVLEYLLRPSGIMRRNVNLYKTHANSATHFRGFAVE